jgi:hypothetical protein
MAQKKTKKAAATRAPAKRASAKKAPARKAPAKRASGVRKAAARPSAPRSNAAPEGDSISSVEELVARLEPRAREIVSALRNVIRKALPAATEELKWGMPVYSHQGLLCYISAQGRRIRFGFYHERMQLTDAKGAPVGRGDMLHVKVDSLEDIQPEQFTRWVQEAARLNAAS